MIFGIPDGDIDVEVHADDNRIPEALKHSNDSMLTREEDDYLSTSNSQVHVERLLVLQGNQVEGEHLSSQSHDHIHDSTVDGEND